MDIAAVMDELGAALAGIDGLRVYPYWSDRVTPPAASVAWPESYSFDRTYGRGADHARFPVTVMVGKVDARSSRDRLAAYANGAGAQSVKAAIDGYAATVWDSARVESAEFEVVTVAGAEYLAATFQVDIYAQGAS